MFVFPRLSQVVPRGAVHVDWNPRSDSLVVATGDKDGHVGIWRVEGGCSTSAPSGSAAKGAAAAGGGGGDAEEEDDDDDNGANDGVFLFKPHAQYICGLKWAQTGAPRLLSGSYDGSIRCLDAGAGQWTELFSGDDELSAFDCDAACGMAFVGGPDGDLRSIDLRSGKAASPAVSAHSRRVNCVHMDPVGGNLVATAAGDSLVCGAALSPSRPVAQRELVLRDSAHQHTPPSLRRACCVVRSLQCSTSASLARGPSP